MSHFMIALNFMTIKIMKAPKKLKKSSKFCTFLRINITKLFHWSGIGELSCRGKSLFIQKQHTWTIYVESGINICKTVKLSFHWVRQFKYRYYFYKAEQFQCITCYFFKLRTRHLIKYNIKGHDINMRCLETYSINLIMKNDNRLL